MALPTLDKTWQFTVNQSYTGASALAATQSLVFGIKQAMRGFGSDAWGCWGSSNGAGTFGNGDSIDRWAASTNLIWNTAGNQHSWIVLTQTGLGVTALCVDLNAANSATASFILFPTGVGSNGTATARPSATDEVVVANALSYGPANAAGSGKFHVLQSSDGQVTRVVVCRGNAATGFWSFEVPKNPVTSTVVGTMVGNSASVAEAATYALLNDVTTYCACYLGGITASLYMMSEGWAAATVGETQTYLDDDTSDYPMSPIYLASSTVGGRGSKKGQLYDIWWGSTAPVTGDCYPGDASKQFAHFSDIILPWNGSTPLIT